MREPRRTRQDPQGGRRGEPGPARSLRERDNRREDRVDLIAGDEDGSDSDAAWSRASSRNVHTNPVASTCCTSQEDVDGHALGHVGSPPPALERGCPPEARRSPVWQPRLARRHWQGRSGAQPRGNHDDQLLDQCDGWGG